jgi:hypothetical protein
LHYDFTTRAVPCGCDADSIRKILIPVPPQQYDAQDKSRIRRGAAAVASELPL